MPLIGSLSNDFITSPLKCRYLSTNICPIALLWRLIFSLSVVSANYLGVNVLNMWRANFKYVPITVFYGCCITTFPNLEHKTMILPLIQWLCANIRLSHSSLLCSFDSSNSTCNYFANLLPAHICTLLSCERRLLNNTAPWWLLGELNWYFLVENIKTHAKQVLDMLFTLLWKTIVMTSFHWFRWLNNKESRLKSGRDNQRTCRNILKMA